MKFMPLQTTDVESNLVPHQRFLAHDLQQVAQQRQAWWAWHPVQIIALSKALPPEEVNASQHSYRGEHKLPNHTARSLTRNEFNPAAAKASPCDSTFDLA